MPLVEHGAPNVHVTDAEAEWLEEAAAILKGKTVPEGRRREAAGCVRKIAQDATRANAPDRGALLSHQREVVPIVTTEEQFPRHSDRLREIAERTRRLSDELSGAAFAATHDDACTENAMCRAFSELEQIGRMLNQASEAKGWGPLCLGIDVRLPRRHDGEVRGERWRT